MPIGEAQHESLVLPVGIDGAVDLQIDVADVHHQGAVRPLDEVRLPGAIQGLLSGAMAIARALHLFASGNCRFVLAGSASLEFEGEPALRLSGADAVTIPDGERHRWSEASEDFELLEDSRP